jgi:Lon protease-like protein
MTKRSHPLSLEPVHYPMIPILGVVCFPSRKVAFKIGRPKSVASLEKALAGERKIFLVTQRDLGIEMPARNQIYDLGLIADVLQTKKEENGIYKVVIKGGDRGRLLKIKSSKGALIATVQTIQTQTDSGKPVTRIMQRVSKLIERYLPLMDETSQKQIREQLGASAPNPSLIADTIASLLPLVSVEDKQVLLETLSPYERLLRIADLLESERDSSRGSPTESKKEKQTRRTQASQGEFVFVGHGRSQLWARVQVFLERDLGLKVIGYESESRVGHSIVPVLEKMLDQTRFAVLILTAEDETSAGTKRARQNVVHEAGLFQGRLGFRKTILLIQEGLEDFSNIAGLQYIPFSDNKIDQTFYELRRTLEREGLIS